MVAKGLAQALRRDEGSTRLAMLVDACMTENNVVVAAALQRGEDPSAAWTPAGVAAGAEVERRCSALVLRDAGLPPSAAAAGDEAPGGNPLLAVQSHIMMLLSPACCAVFRGQPPAAGCEEAADLAQFSLRLEPGAAAGCAAEIVPRWPPGGRAKEAGARLYRWSMVEELEARCCCELPASNCICIGSGQPGGDKVR